MKQSGGFIWVYSEAGLGTTFKIYLPGIAQEVHLPVNRAAEAAPVPGTETLLLVEDESAVRNSEREFLARNGYTVLEAKNGTEGLRIAREYEGIIHLLLTDVVMPNMGGPQLAEQLAAERPQMRVLFVSGYAESTILRRGVVDLRTSFLQKPFSLRTLAAKIHQVLESRAAAAGA